MRPRAQSPSRWTHPISGGAVWSCVALGRRGMNRRVSLRRELSLSLRNREQRPNVGAHLVAGLALLSWGTRLSGVSLGGTMHTRPSLAWPVPGLRLARSWRPLPGPGPHPGCGGRRVGWAPRECSPHLRGSLCSLASQAPHRLQAHPGKIRRVSPACPCWGDQRPHASPALPDVRLLPGQPHAPPVPLHNSARSLPLPPTPPRDNPGSH